MSNSKRSKVRSIVQQCVLFALILALSLGLASCSGSSDKAAVSEAPQAAPNIAPAERAVVEEIAYDTELAGAADLKITDRGTVGLGDRKVIRDAYLKAEVENVEEAYASLLAYAVERQGYETSRLQVSEPAPSLEATIRIVPDELDGFLAFAGTIGRILYSNVSSSDITDQYLDIETRIKTLEKALEQYYTMLSSTKEVADLVDVQSRIDEVTVELEYLRHKAKMGLAYCRVYNLDPPDTAEAHCCSR